MNKTCGITFGRKVDISHSLVNCNAIIHGLHIILVSQINMIKYCVPKKQKSLDPFHNI